MSRALHTLRPRRLMALAAADFRSLSRDPILLVVLFFIFLPPVLARVWRQALNAFGAAQLGLPDFVLVLTGPILAITGLLTGWMMGMLLLEDRDEGTLRAMGVTPAGRNGFMLYRGLITALATAAGGAFALTVLDYGSGARGGMLLLFTALQALIVATALTAFAGNKVEGLALSKVLNIGALMTFLALLPAPLRYVAAPLPPFWTGELILNGASLPLPVAAGLGLLSHGLVLALLARKAAARLD